MDEKLALEKNTLLKKNKQGRSFDIFWSSVLKCPTFFIQTQNLLSLMYSSCMLKITSFSLLGSFVHPVSTQEQGQTFSQEHWQSIV